MDYSTFFSSQQPQPQQRQQPYPNLTAANLQNLQTNAAFQLNPSPPTLTQHTTDQCPQTNISPLQANNLAQLQTNMFYMDPFETNSKVETGQGNDMDGSYSSILLPELPFLFIPVQSLVCCVHCRQELIFIDESDVFLDELDDISRTATVSQSRRSINPNPSTAGRNHSPQKPQTLLLPSPADFDLSDLTSQDFMDVSAGGNTTKRKAQNRAAQRAFRERKERHVKELEAKVSELESLTKRMQEENDKLRGKLSKLESENNVLKGSNTTFTFPVLKPLTPLSPPPAIDFIPFIHSPPFCPTSLSPPSSLLFRSSLRYSASSPHYLSLPVFRKDIHLLIHPCPFFTF